MSTPTNLRNGNTLSLTDTWLGIGLVSQPCSASDTPAITLAAILATGIPVAFDTNGTVRLARGLTSSTYTFCRPSSFLIANCTFISPMTRSLRARACVASRISARIGPGRL